MKEKRVDQGLTKRGIFTHLGFGLQRVLTILRNKSLDNLVLVLCDTVEHFSSNSWLHQNTFDSMGSAVDVGSEERYGRSLWHP